MLDEYTALAEHVVSHAPSTAPVLTGFSACVDAVYQLRGVELDLLAACSHSELAGAILTRVRRGRGGEIVLECPEGPQWVEDTLGPPDRLQIGGTGPQASWALAEIGASSTLALADRSHEQLSVLHPAIRVCEQRKLVPLGICRPRGESRKPRHYVLEFTAGTRYGGGVVPRSSRVIVRFAEDGLETDEEFAAMSGAMAPDCAAGLLSGLNGLSARNQTSRAWLHDVVKDWRLSGLPVIHLELAEYPRVETMTALCAEYGRLANSVGMSLSELRALTGSTNADIGALAHGVAERFGFRRVCVHSDQWSLSVHRGDARRERTALLVGNALAAARARVGSPTAWLGPENARFTDDHPRSGPLVDAWRVECVAAPYWPRPVSTIGLGDTFVAGTLLALSPSWPI